jgi:hypothetical protein
MGQGLKRGIWRSKNIIAPFPFQGLHYTVIIKIIYNKYIKLSLFANIMLSLL